MFYRENAALTLLSTITLQFTLCSTQKDYTAFVALVWVYYTSILIECKSFWYNLFDWVFAFIYFQTVDLLVEKCGQQVAALSSGILIHSFHVQWSSHWFHYRCSDKKWIKQLFWPVKCHWLIMVYLTLNMYKRKPFSGDKL